MVEVIYGHVMTREEHYVGRRVMVRKRGRPQRRWLDKVQDDINYKGLSADEVFCLRPCYMEAYVIV